MDLHETVHNLMAEKNVKQVQLSKDLGISKSVISKFLSGKMIDFYYIFCIIKYLDAVNYLEVMDSFCHDVDTPVSIQNALEYASTFNRVDLMENLLSDHADRKGALKDWLTVYRLHSNFKNLDVEIVLEECRELYGKVTSPELKVKLDLIEAAVHYRSDKMLMLKISEKLESKINVLKDGFIKESFKIRLFAYFAPAVLYVNEDTEKAIKFAQEVICSPVSSSLLVAASYHTMSHAYLFSSEDKSIEYIDKAVRLLKSEGYDNKVTDIQANDYSFVRSYYGKHIDLDSLKGEELAHQLIVRGQEDEARKVLESIDNETPFSSLYLGIVNKDFSQLLKAHGMMVRTGNTYFLKVFERELSRIFHNSEGANIHV